jgi:HK97 family phage portal protein
MDAGQIGINPADAQLLESRAYSTEEICSWFRVQPFMIGRASQGQTNWGTGIEQQMIGFITFTLRPWLKRIEESIAADLLTPAERATYYAEFNLEGLLRGDSAARASFYQVLLQNGILSRNEVRRLENLPPIEGGDVYTVQSNLIPIDKLGQSDPSAEVRSAFLSWLAPNGEPYAPAAAA